MSNRQLILLWIGFGCFALASINVNISPINLTALGLALCTLAYIVK